MRAQTRVNLRVVCGKAAQNDPNPDVLLILDLTGTAKPGRFSVNDDYYRPLDRLLKNKLAGGIRLYKELDDLDSLSATQRKSRLTAAQKSSLESGHGAVEAIDSDEWYGPVQDYFGWQVALAKDKSRTMPDTAHFGLPEYFQRWSKIEQRPITGFKTGSNGFSSDFSVEAGTGGISVGGSTSRSTQWNASEVRVRSYAIDESGSRGNLTAGTAYEFNQLDGNQEFYWPRSEGAEGNGYREVPTAFENFTFDGAKGFPVREFQNSLKAQYVWKLDEAPKTGHVWVCPHMYHRAMFCEADGTYTFAWVGSHASQYIRVSWDSNPTLESQAAITFWTPNQCNKYEQANVFVRVVP
jgi:hypothetical protein